MMHVLSIEDSGTTRELLARIFHRLAPEFVVEFAPDLSTGLRKAREKQYDVVLLDLILPDSLTGCESTTQVALASKAPVIILSGLPQPTADEAAEECLTAGACDYFQKQLINTDADVLVRVMRKQSMAHKGRLYLATKS